MSDKSVWRMFPAVHVPNIWSEAIRKIFTLIIKLCNLGKSLNIICFALLFFVF